MGVLNTEPAKGHDRRDLIAIRNRDRSLTGKPAAIFRRRYPEVADESPPHAFVVAESCTPSHLDHAADFAAFEQQPRGFHPQRFDSAGGRHSSAAAARK